MAKTQKKKRANGEGTFTKLPSGKTRGRFIDEIDGVTVRKSFTGSSETDCRNQHKEWLKSPDKVAIEHIKTVEQWAAQWLKIYKKPEPGQPVNTYRSYEMFIKRHINPAIGGKKLINVREAHIIQLLKDARTKPTKAYPKGKPLSRSSAEKVLWALRGIFGTAIKNNLCVVSPISDGIVLPEKSEKPPSVFSTNHMKEIVSYIFEHENGLYLALYLYSGLRPGEGFGLMWSDRDKKSHSFRVSRSLTRIEEIDEVTEKSTYALRITPGTKTKEERTVIYNTALDRLLDSAPKDGLYILSRKIVSTNDLGEETVSHTNHTHTTYNDIYYSFLDDLNKKLEAQAAALSALTGKKIPFDPVPKLSPHKMRHTFATYLRRGGADLNEIREILGHVNVSTTQIYDTVDLEDMTNAQTKLPY